MRSSTGCARSFTSMSSLRLARRGVGILPSNVWLFDDRSMNIVPFRGTGMNAKMISCATRQERAKLFNAPLCPWALVAELFLSGIQKCRPVCVVRPPRRQRAIDSNEVIACHVQLHVQHCFC